MTVMLFEAFDPDDYEDAEAAWQTTRYDQECRAHLHGPKLTVPACMTSLLYCMSPWLLVLVHCLKQHLLQPITSTVPSCPFVYQ